MLRLFVALALPEAVTAALERLTFDGMPGARWVEPENMHITLRFIGEVDEHDAEEIHHELSRVRAPPFSLSLAGVDTFGQGRKTRALWVGVDKSEPLNLLRGRVESAVVRAGRPPEPRKFVPHVTLARFHSAPPDRILAFIQNNNLFRCGPIACEGFTLFESQAGGDSVIYTPLQEYELDPAP
jgi:2'-5' RNA ligase